MRKLSHFAIALLGAQAAAGCSLEDPGVPPAGGGGLEPPPPGAGVQYRMTSTLAPGQEIERCKLVVVPPEGLHIQRDEVRYSPGSHHVVLYRTPYTEVPAETLAGVPVDGTEVHDCNDGAFALWAINGVIAGSQSFSGNSFLGELPEGVALRVEPGTVLVMNTHYLNASPDPVASDARVNLYTIPPERVEVEASVLFHYNTFIRVPANGVSSARMRCTIDRDISVVRVQSHMHSRGVGFVAHHVTGGGAMEEIYSNEAWEQVPARDFDPLLRVKAGEALDFRCDYKNPEARDVVQGLTTKDEMCMLIGPYFPRDPRIDACTDANGDAAETWIGSGAATCAETLACIAAASPIEQDQGADLYGCMVESCPGAAAEISAFMRCQSSLGYHACQEACGAGEGDGGCASCLSTACGTEVTACQQAGCGG